MTQSKSFFVLYPFAANFGGIERLIVDLATFLRAHGCTLELLAFQSDVDFSRYGAPDLKVHRISSARNLRAESAALKAHIQQHAIATDRILVMEMRGVMYAGLALDAGYSLHIADPPSLLPNDISKHSFSLAADYPTQTEQRTVAKRVRGQIVHWLAKRGVRKAGCPITMTQKNVKELSRIYGVEFYKVPPGVSIPESAERATDDRTIRFLSVCRLEPSKRIDAIIRSLAAVITDSCPKDRHIELKIVGKGSEEAQLKQLVSDCRLNDHVHFAGFLTEEELEQAYACSDVFVMPAKQGYGLPGLESLVRGLQLVVHRESGVTEFLTKIPQVQIIDNFEASLTTAMKNAAASAKQPHPLPNVPTAEQWSAAIADHSGWNI